MHSGMVVTVMINGPFRIADVATKIKRYAARHEVGLQHNMLKHSTAGQQFDNKAVKEQTI